MTDKRGPTVAWLCAVLVTMASLLIAAGAARAVHAQTAPPTLPPPSAAKSSGGQSNLSPGDHPLQISSEGRTRTFLVHVPTGFVAGTPPAKPLPVVVMLHGAGGSGKQAEAQTGWDKKADKETFLAVFPDALPVRLNLPASLANPRFWRDGSNRGATVGGTQSASIDDAAFIGAVLDDIAKRFPIDEKRVFVTGFSSGASMTFRLLVSPLSSRIAAASLVSGHLWVKNAAPPAHAVPLLMFWGTADPVNPIAGGGAGAVSKPSLQADISAYAKAIGTTDKPAPISDEKGVKRVAYGPGKNGAELLVTTVDGAGHVWPGGKSGLLAGAFGPDTDKINATDTIWAFFDRHFLAPRSVNP